MIPLEFCENRLLSSLPADDTALLQSHLRVAFLHSGATLFQAGHAVQLAYFPLRGAIALTTILSAGQMIETALVGRNGNIGGYAALARQPATCNAIVRINGEALTIEAGRLRQLAAERPAIAAMLYREHSASLAESQHSAACAAAHSLQARFCRWLLWARDVSGASPIAITQECVADLLGVRRTSICLIAHRLQQEGVIRVHRGRTEIRDDDALRQLACECYTRIAALRLLSVSPEFPHVGERRPFLPGAATSPAEGRRTVRELARE